MIQRRIPLRDGDGLEITHAASGFAAVVGVDGQCADGAGGRFEAIVDVGVVRIAAFRVRGIGKIGVAIVFIVRSLFSRVGDGSYLAEPVVSKAGAERIRVRDLVYIAVRIVFEVGAGIKVGLTDAAQKHGFAGQQAGCRVKTAHHFREPVFQRILDFRLGDARSRIK